MGSSDSTHVLKVGFALLSVGRNLHLNSQICRVAFRKRRKVIEEMEAMDPDTSDSSAARG